MSFQTRNTLILLAGLGYITSSYLNASDNDFDQYEGYIAETLKKTLSKTDDRDVKRMMADHYKQFKLMNAKGEWKAQLLKRYGQDLMPDGMGVKSLEQLTDQMAKGAHENKYIHNAIKALFKQKTDLKTLLAKFDDEGEAVIPDALAYAMVLENMTTTTRKHKEILSDINKIWDEEKEKLWALFHIGVFGAIKLYSLDDLSFLWQEPDEQGEVHCDPNHMSTRVSVNIMEAMCSDFVIGNYNNVWTGYILTKHHAGEKNKASGAGASKFINTDDGQELRLTYPHPKLWKDLYGAWNTAFVSGFPNFPYFMAKLLIPQVISTSKHPGSYMQNRAIALYYQVHHELFGRAYGGKSGKSMNWAHSSFTRIFGEVNKKSADQYDALVQKSNVDELDESEDLNALVVNEAPTLSPRSWSVVDLS